MLPDNVRLHRVNQKVGSGSTGSSFGSEQVQGGGLDDALDLAETEASSGW